MTLTRRLRAADPLGGTLPDALPIPDRARAEVLDVEVWGRRRRNTGRWVLTGGAVALACAVLAVVLGRDGDDGAQRSATGADVAAIARLSPKYAARFAVLRRPATRDDALPERVLGLLPAGVTGQTEARYARLIARQGGDRVWVLPGRTEVCVVYSAAGKQVGYRCGTRALVGNYAVEDRSVVYALLPDGVTDARLEQDGKTLTGVPIHGNGLLAATRIADELTWRTSLGHRARAQLHTPGIYTPSAQHDSRPPGSVYNDEIGENIVGLRTPYVRVLELFGPPVHRVFRDSNRTLCAYYAVVGSPNGWQFCFRDGLMTSATGNFAERDFPKVPQTP